VTDLFRILTDEPAPPSQLRVEDVLTAGRSRVRNRRVGTLVAAAVAVVLVIGGMAVAARGGPRQGMPADPPSPPATSCTVSALTPVRAGDVSAAVRAIDPGGRHIVGFVTDDDPAVVLWTDGKPAVITTDLSMRPWAVNRAGTLVGERVVDDDSVPMVYRDGRFADLPLPPDAKGGMASGINTRGDIVGHVVLAGGRSVAARWSAGGSGPPTLLPGAEPSRAFGIRDDGTAVGMTGDFAQQYLWHPDGRGEALAVPPGKPGGAAHGIDGDVVWGTVDRLARMTVDPASGKRVLTSRAPGARWDLRTGAVEVLTGFTPDAMASDGTMAGTIGDNLAEPEPARWRGGAAEPLPLLTVKTDRVSEMGMSADGRTIVGTLIDRATGAGVPTVWRC
jgi:hypothetical protein